MKKLLLIALCFLGLFFVSCTEVKPVRYMEVKEKSYGQDITFYSFGSSDDMTAYTLLKPAASLGTPTLIVKHFPKGAELTADSVKKYENAVIGEITYEGGKIKTIIINNVKYVNTK